VKGGGEERCDGVGAAEEGRERERDREARGTRKMRMGREGCGRGINCEPISLYMLVWPYGHLKLQPA